MKAPDAALDRGQFLNSAALVQGGLIVAAICLAWIADIRPMNSVLLEQSGWVYGVLGTLPMLGFFALTYHLPLPALRRIREFLIDVLGPLLVLCRWYDLVLLAILAGVSEEILFRGVLQPWLGAILNRTGLFGESLLTGIVASNILFGLAHLITPLYGLLAMLMGCYLAAVQQMTPDQNLLAPIVTHAVYDWIVFLIIRRVHIRRTGISLDHV